MPVVHVMAPHLPTVAMPWCKAGPACARELGILRQCGTWKDRASGFLISNCTMVRGAVVLGASAALAAGVMLARCGIRSLVG